jgi:hypothetical protein
VAGVSANGHKPRPDPAILTPNDLKRCKVALGGQSPHELLAEPETMFQVLILALGLRDDPGYTFERAGDEALGDWFDMSSDEPDPQTAVPGSPGPGAATKPASSSRTRRASSAPAPSSAASSASPAPSTTP